MKRNGRCQRLLAFQINVGSNTKPTTSNIRPGPSGGVGRITFLDSVLEEVLDWDLSVAVGFLLEFLTGLELTKTKQSVFSAGLVPHSLLHLLAQLLPFLVRVCTVDAEALI